MQDIYLVRHGETEWNAAGRFQGSLDSALTRRGMAQAEAMGRRLADVAAGADSFVASPLGRTRQTATIIQDCGSFRATEFDARLAEVSTGSWDGLTHEDIDAEWPGALDGSTAFDWFFRAPDGESYEAAFSRVEDWLGDVQGTVIAVSHGLIGRIVRAVYLGLAREEALCLPVPQDVIWHLRDGEIRQIGLA